MGAVAVEILICALWWTCMLRFGSFIHCRPKSCQCSSIVSWVFFGIAFCLVSAPSKSQVNKILTPQVTPSPAAQALLTPSPTPIQAVPLPQIAEQAEELERQIRKTSKSLIPVPDRQVESLEAEARADEISRRASQLEDLLTGTPNRMQLQQEDRYWRALEEEYARKRKLLTVRAADIEEMMQWLDKEQARWEATAGQVRESAGLEVVAGRVEQELEAIQELRSEAQERLNVILTLQNHISEQDRELSAVLRKLDEAQERLRVSLFERDSRPLWQYRQQDFPGQSLSTVIRLSVSRGFTGTREFLRAQKPSLMGMVSIYVLALFIAFRLRNYAASEDKSDVIINQVKIFLRPFSVALLVALLPVLGVLASAPTGVSFVICFLCVAPVLRLLPRLAPPAVRKVVYTLCVFYVAVWAHQVLQFGSAFGRGLFVFIILLALIVLIWLTRPSRLKIQSVSAWHLKFVFAANTIGLSLLAVSVIANVIGFVSLAQVLGVGTLFSAFAFALLYTMVRVLQLGVTIAVNSTWFQVLPDVQAGVIERWTWRLLVVFACFLWLDVNLYLFTIRSNVVSTLRSMLQHPITFGKSQVTMGGTLNLFLFLFFGYAIANIASFILGKILLPKLTLRGGMAYAISRFTYYVLLGTLFFAGLANTGLELNKFTVITGALGLGVGFGLQNIVNNFASGLIILFERPIRIGDTVEIGGVSGIVRRIGARSSTVLTFQGAEVILPNSNLLSNQVTNWTLSSTRRLVEIPVRVSYGTDPALALKLLMEIATSNPHVLAHPRPETLFLGFGESSLNVELRFWAAQSVWFELKSQISMAILESFRNAGIEIPYPQRDLRVRSIDSLAKEELAATSDAQTIKKTFASG
jgi:potassium-dependent mechanosensitive channel